MTKKDFSEHVMRNRKEAISKKDGKEHLIIRPHPTLTDDDANEFLRRFEASRYKSKAKFCEDLIMRRPSVDMRSAMRNLTKMLVADSNNLNQIARYCHTFQSGAGQEHRLTKAISDIEIIISRIHNLAMLGDYLADMQDRVCYEPFFDDSPDMKSIRSGILKTIQQTVEILACLENDRINQK